MKLEISQSTIDSVRAVMEKNKCDYDERMARLEAEAANNFFNPIKFHSPPPLPASRHRLTHAESVDRAQLLALFDQLDSRGQRTTLAMLAVAVKLHPRS